MNANDSTRSRLVWTDETSDLTADLSQVAERIADLDAWPAWVPGLASIRRVGKGRVRVGSWFTMALRLPGKPKVVLPCKVMQWEPSRFEWGGGFAGSEIRHSFELTSLAAGGTRVRQLEYATGALRLAVRPFEKVAARHNRGFQQALEAHFGALG